MRDINLEGERLKRVGVRGVRNVLIDQVTPVQRIFTIAADNSRTSLWTVTHEAKLETGGARILYEIDRQGYVPPKNSVAEDGMIYSTYPTTSPSYRIDWKEKKRIKMVRTENGNRDFLDASLCYKQSKEICWEGDITSCVYVIAHTCIFISIARKRSIVPGNRQTDRETSFGRIRRKKEVGFINKSMEHHSSG